MAIKPKKPTSKNYDYEKERRRVQRLVKKAEKEGYIFDKSPVPKKPKRVRQQSIDNLAKIDFGWITKKAKTTPKKDKNPPKKIPKSKKPKTNPIKGKAIPPYEPSLPKESTVVLDNIREFLRQWTPLLHWGASFRELKRERKNALEILLESSVAKDGETVVARRLQNSSDDVASIVNQIIYDSEKNVEVNFLVNRFATIVTGRALTMEEARKLSELSEESEDFF